jgi:leader peptidase (prepilin peptidase)/N-methyltransferase
MSPALVLLGAAAGATAGGLLIAALAAATAHRADMTVRRMLPAGAGCGAVAGAVLAAAGLPTPVTAALVVAITVAAAAALVDAAEHRLPNKLTGSLLAAGVLLCTMATAVTGWGSPLRALAGLLIFGGWMLILAAVDAGPGDVKLAAGIGWWLAWMSWWVFVAGVAVALLGMAATLIANRWIRDRPRSPLGPGIVTGLIIGVLATAWLS